MILKRFVIACICFLFFTVSFAQVTVFVTADKTEGCAPLRVTFTNESSDFSGVTYIWNFGTGAPPVTSNEVERQIVYESGGEYTVTLTADFGTHKISESIVITVFTPPQAQFNYTIQSCVPATGSFQNTSVKGDGEITEVRWNFGDGRYVYGNQQSKTYTVQAEYEAYLRVLDDNACSSEIVQSVFVYNTPSAEFALDTNFSCNPPLEVQPSLTQALEPHVLYHWNYGNGQSYVDAHPPKALYSNHGEYTISLNAQAGPGCSASSSKQVDVGVPPSEFSIYYGGLDNPIADFQAIPPGQLLFERHSERPYTYIWRINGVEYTQTIPSVLFCEPGEYTVELISGSNLPCPQTVSRTFRIAHASGSSIEVRQQNNLVLQDACPGDIQVFSPFVGATNTFTIQGEQKSGNWVTYNLCETNTYQISLLANFNNQCEYTITRNLTVADCDVDNILFNAQGISYSDENPSLCRGVVSFSLPQQAMWMPEWTINGESFSQHTPQRTICTVGENLVRVSGTSRYNCPFTREKTFVTHKCYTDNFILEDVATNTPFMPNDTLCINTVLRAVPDSLPGFYDWITPMTMMGGFFYYNTEPGLNMVQMRSYTADNCLDTVTNFYYGEDVKAEFSIDTVEFACVFPARIFVNNTSEHAHWFHWNVRAEFGDIVLYDSLFSQVREPILDLDGYYYELDSLRHYSDSVIITVTLRAFSQYGCVDTAVVQIIKTNPLANFLPEKPFACVGENLQFESRDLAGFNFIDSVDVFDPKIGEFRRVGRKVYREIEHIYWHWGDGSVTHIAYDDLQSFRDDVDECIYSKFPLTPSDIIHIENIILEQEGIGEFYAIREYLAITYPERMRMFDTCVANRKHLSKRMVEHAYAAPGVYSVFQIVEDAGGCRDTSYHVEIRIGEKDLGLDFTLSKTEICHDETIQIQGISSNPHIDAWHFFSKDLQFSSECKTNTQTQQLNISPLSTGLTDIRLRAYHNGCMSEIVKQNAIEIKGPVGHFVFPVDCGNPTRYQFFETLHGADSWTWDFGDSHTEQNTINPVHTYAESGNYTVSLTAHNATSGCNDFVYSFPVKVRRVQAIADYTPEFCPALEISVPPQGIDVDTTGRFEPYVWFVDNEVQRRKWDMPLTIRQKYYRNNPDSIAIMLVAVDENRCEDTLRFYMYPRPIKAKITANKTSMCGPQDSIRFTFSNLDSTITQWRWQFGDGSWTVQDISDNDSSITHVYSIPRNTSFHVMLNADDENGCFATDTLTVYGYYRTADYVVNNAICWQQDTAKFTALSADLDSSFWDFADGNDTLLTFYQVEHVYQHIGSYTPRHIGYYKTCTDTAYNRVIVNTPKAPFVPESPVACTKKPLAFIVTEPLDYATGTWYFPETNPFHYIDGREYYAFYETGLKTVSLQLQFGSCSDSASAEVIINGADFSLLSPLVCVGNSVTFINEVQQIPDSLHWFFGDGSELITTLDTITHTYGDRGLYNVQLIAYKEGCNDTVLRQNSVSVQDVDATFWLSDDVICAGEDVQFYHPHILDAQHGTWFFDSINSTSYTINDTMVKPYTRIGKVRAGLRVVSSNGCVDTSFVTIHVNGADGSFRVEPPVVCKGEQVQFIIEHLINTESHTWFFGDGDISTEDSPVHSYELTGRIPTHLELRDPTGCITYKPFTLEVTDVLADFDISPSEICQFETVYITNNSRSAISWEWNMGDGTVIQNQELDLYTYTRSGTFDISLSILGNHNCDDAHVQQILVNPAPHIAIIGPDSLCVEEPLMLVAEHDANITQLAWYMNSFPFAFDEDTVYDQPTESLVYTVSVVGDNGCNNSDTLEVFVEQYPYHIVGPLDTIVAIGDTIIPYISSSLSSEFIWETISEGISCLDCLNPKIFAPETHQYFVTIKDWCFEETYTLTISVIPTIKMDVPQAFTPNGDGVNDILYVRGWGIRELEYFRVYNRWGQLVFESKSMDKGWDGTFRGEAQSTETFSYTAKGISFLGDEIEIKGYVTLIR